MREAIETVCYNINYLSIFVLGLIIIAIITGYVIGRIKK